MFKDLPIRIAYSGDIATVCEAGLHALYSSTASVKIFSAISSVDGLAGLTCGMGVLVGSNVPIEIVVAPMGSQLDEPPSDFSPERLGILSEALEEKRLSLSVLHPEKLGALLSMPDEVKSYALLTDADGETILIIWQLTLNVETYNPVHCTVSWEYGDPNKMVGQFRNQFKSFKSEDIQKPSRNTEKLIELISKIPKATPPFEEPTAPTLVENGITLYQHQEDAITAWVENKYKGIFKMCTGAGKTISSLAAISRIPDPQNVRCPVLVSVPTRVLADQWIDEIEKMGFSKPLRAFERSSNWLQKLGPWFRSDTNEKRRIAVTTYASMADERFISRLQDLGRAGVRGLWVADEMHNLASDRLLQLTKQVGQTFPLRIGLSATPEIEGDEKATNLLNDFFSGICAEYLLKDGIKQGVLCPYKYYPHPAYLSPDLGREYMKLLAEIDATKSGSPKLFDLYRQSRETVRTSGVQTKALKEVLLGLVEEGKSLKHTLIYCPAGYSKPVETSDAPDEEDIGKQQRLLEEVVKVVREFDGSVASILGDTPKNQRDLSLQKFGEGSCDVMCAIGCLDEGVDVPSIQRAIVLSSIDRERQFVQRRGRILRKPRGVKKVAEIIDVVILPQGGTISESDAARLLEKEMRRYRIFSDIALNQKEAQKRIDDALTIATKEL